MPNKKIFSKGLIAFLIIFACIAFGVTGALVALKKQSVESQSPNPMKISEDYGLHDLTQKYWVNNLEATEVNYNEGGKVWLSNYFDPYKLNVSYYAIDGLKNLDVQNKINEKIKDEAFRLVPTEYADAKSVTSYIEGNFSNILSIHFSSSSYIKKDNNDYEYISGKASSLTFNLTTGNLIDLKDCFVDKANINMIISNSAYVSSAWNEKYIYGEWDAETQQLIEYDRRDLDEVALKTILDIKNGNYYFTVSDYYIAINTPDNCITIEFERYHDDIAIFNRFATKESIFTDKYDKGYEAYFGIPYMSKNINEPTDNLITISDLYLDGYKEDKEIIEELIEKRFKLDKKIAEENPKTVIVEIMGSREYGWDLYDKIYDKLDSSEKYYLEGHSISVSRAEIPKKYYEDNDIRNKIFDILRNGYNSERGEVSYLFEDYFNSLKEENKEILVTSRTHGKIYSYVPNYDKWDERELKYIAQDYDTLQSSTKLLTEEDLIGLSQDELNKAYNELFARHGHSFKSKDLKEYFFSFLWYTPIEGKQVSVDELTEIEQKNLSMIKSRIDELKNQ